MFGLLIIFRILKEGVHLMGKRKIQYKAIENKKMRYVSRLSGIWARVSPLLLIRVA